MDNLKKIKKVQSLYSSSVKFGYADHTSWDNENNELISLLISANDMSYTEKHVTNQLGVERTDFSAAITIPMFNELCKKSELISDISGDGSLTLNSAEADYSKYGPNKMAALALEDLKAGEVFSPEKFTFIRTSQITSLSQIDLLDKLLRFSLKIFS